MPAELPLLPLAEAEGRSLLWTRTRLFGARYELKAGEAVAAILSRSGFAGLLWEARTAADRWTIRGRGFLRTRVEIRPVASGAPGGVLHRRPFGMGRLELRGGGRYELRGGGLLWRKRSFVGPGGARIVSFRPTWSPRDRYVVEVEPSGWARRELGLLLLLGCHEMARWRRIAAAG